jgi:hypothetical protein
MLPPLASSVALFDLSNQPPPLTERSKPREDPSHQSKNFILTF